MKRPDVLLIYTDQQRWDAFGKMNEHCLTPNMDRLADEGAWFDHAFCNNPVCMPSRMSMLSGQYPSALGIGCNGIELPEETVTVNRVLSQYGYHTGNMGKIHFKNHSTRDHREPYPSYGFDTMIVADEPGCYDCSYIAWVRNQAPDQVDNCRTGTPPAYQGKPFSDKPRHVTKPYDFEGPEDMTHSGFVADQTVEYLKQRQSDGRPFFAIAGFYAPHPPFNPPKKFVDMYDPDKLPAPVAWDRQDRFGLDEKDWKKVKQYYYALTTHMDDQMGKILTYLDEAGMKDDTIVIFTSDHGEHLGDRGGIQKGPPGLDSCSRVPLIIRYPKAVKAGTRHGDIIEAVDIVPTILDFCGVDVPPQMKGRSFRPLVTGKEYGSRSSALIEFKVPMDNAWRSVRTKTHFYSIDAEGNELLFDMVKDPDQLTNAVDDPLYEGVLSGLRKEALDRGFDAESPYPLKTGQY